MRLRSLTMLGLACWLAACGGSGMRREFARYDLGAVAVAPAPSTPILAERLDVVASPWLASTEMHYRLLASDAQRRRSYSESRWSAPPAELLAVALRRQSSIGQPGSGQCRVLLRLNELEQRFDADGRSRMHLDATAQLLPPRGDGVLARRNLELDEAVAAERQSAAGGAAALAQLSARLAQQIDDWLRAGTVDAEHCPRRR